MANVDDTKNLFSYHKPTGEQALRYEQIRDAAREFANVVLANTPASAEQTLAIRDLQRCVMMANCSIAVNEKGVL